MSRFLDAKISTLPRQWSSFENHNNPFMIISLTCVYDIARTLQLFQIGRFWGLQLVEFYQSETSRDFTHENEKRQNCTLKTLTVL